MKEKIIEDYKNGMTPLDISHKYGVSRSYVYQCVNYLKTMDIVGKKPIVDDSKVVQELKAKIEELEQKNKALEETNARLVKIIEKLTD